QLDRLMLADRLAEGLAHLGIGDRLRERRVRDPDPARRDVDAPELEPAENLLQAAPFDAADQPACRHAVVIEGELAGVDAAVAELLKLALDGKARPLLGEEH